MLFIAEIVIFFLCFCEYTRSRTLASPFILLGGLYLISMPLVNTVGVAMDFNRLTHQTILFNMFFLILCYMAGCISRQRMGKAVISFSKKIRNVENKLLARRKAVFNIFLISVCCNAISLAQTIARYGLDGTKSHAFGIFAHIAFFARSLMPVIYFYYLRKRQAKYLVACLAEVLILILFKGKYHLYIPVMGCIVISLMAASRIKFLKILKIICGMGGTALALFVALYTVVPNILDGDFEVSGMLAGIGFSIKHFFHYLFCPFITANEYYKMPVFKGFKTGINVILNPFDVLYQWITGIRDFKSPVIEYWPVVDAGGATANVGGMFSETVFHIGYFGAVAYVLIIGFLVYCFYTEFHLYGKWIITTTYLLSLFSLCFFCNFFTLQPNFECLCYCMLMDVVLLDFRWKIVQLTGPAGRGEMYYENIRGYGSI